MQGARIIDDTYNANPISLKAALNVLSSYEGMRYMVIGDMSELGDEAIDFHSGAGIAIKQADIEGLFTIGELSIKATQAYGDDALHFESYAALNEMLIALLSKDTTILVKGSRSMQMERVVNTLTEEQS